MTAHARAAGAPITWGVCEVPGWGHQLSPERVLQEMGGMGLRATELGPEGYLPAHPVQLRELLSSHGLALAGGFVPLVLHRPEVTARALELAARVAALLRDSGARVMVVAGVAARDGYDGVELLDDGDWETLVETLDRVVALGSEQGVTVTLHPHHGTVIESAGAVTRLLESSVVDLCLDTGHLALGGADPVEITQSAVERIAHVHLKDVDRSVAEQLRAGDIDYRSAVASSLYRPLGDGDLDIEAVVSLLESSGYSGWYVLEQDAILSHPPPPEGGPALDARTSLEWLHKVIEKNGRDGTSGDRRSLKKGVDA